jgi:hypothetical protein
MFHLNDRTLERLVTGSASIIEVDRIRRHIEECRACARRLEEWRDTFPEVDQHFPSLAHEFRPLSAATAGGLVLVPPSEPRRSRFLDLANILWGLAVVLALMVGYGLSKLGQEEFPEEPQMSSFAYGATGYPRADTARRTAPVPLPPRQPVGARDTVPDAPDPAPESTVTRPATERESLAPEPSTRGAATAEPEATGPAAPPPLPISRGFARIPRVEAARRLGGPVRGIRGLEPDHYEVGPPTAAPGAQKNIDVVRVVYRTGVNGRLILDQQAIPVDESGFRPIDDPALESGETVYRAGPDGSNTAVWLDEAGYRLALTARVSQDSLRRLVARVQ